MTANMSTLKAVRLILDMRKDLLTNSMAEATDESERTMFAVRRDEVRKIEEIIDALIQEKEEVEE